MGFQYRRKPFRQVCHMGFPYEGSIERRIRQEGGQLTIGTIDQSRRTAARIVGWTYLLAMAVVVFGEHSG